MSAARPSALPRRIATSGPRRSATAPQTRNMTVVAAGGQDADDPDVGQRQVQAVDIDDRVQRQRGDHPAAVEPLRDRDPREDRPIAQGADRIAGREGRRPFRVRCPETGVGKRTAESDEAGEGDSGLATELVGHHATSQCGDGRRRRPSGTQETDDPAADTGRVHRAPQAQVERAAQRQAEPEHDRHDDHDRRRGQDRQDEQGRGPDPPDERQLALRSRTDPSGERAEEVGDERRGSQGGQADRFEAAAAGDGRQQGRHQGHRHADTDRRRRDRARGCARPRADAAKDGSMAGTRRTSKQPVRPAR